MNASEKTQVSATARAFAASTGPASVPATTRWSPDLDPFSIHVSRRKSVPAGSFGEASRRGIYRLSSTGSVLSFCETPAHYPLRVRFYVDAEGLPRPAPFPASLVSATVTFGLADRSTPLAVRSVADPSPRYTGPGRWLQAAFGDVIDMTGTGRGTLGVTAALVDPDTQTTVRYSDEIPCRLEPCA